MYLCQLDLKVHQKVNKETHTVIPLKELVSTQINDLLLKPTPVRCTYHKEVMDFIFEDITRIRFGIIDYLYFLLLGRSYFLLPYISALAM